MDDLTSANNSASVTVPNNVRESILQSIIFVQRISYSLSEFLSVYQAAGGGAPIGPITIANYQLKLILNSAKIDLEKLLHLLTQMCQQPVYNFPLQCASNDSEPSIAVTTVTDEQQLLTNSAMGDHGLNPSVNDPTDCDDLNIYHSVDLSSSLAESIQMTESDEIEFATPDGVRQLWTNALNEAKEVSSIIDNAILDMSTDEEIQNEQSVENESNDTGDPKLSARQNMQEILEDALSDEIINSTPLSAGISITEESSTLLQKDQKLSKHQDEFPSNITVRLVTEESSTLLQDAQKLSECQDGFSSKIVDGLITEESSTILQDDQKLSERQDEFPSNITDGLVTEENSTLLQDDQKLSQRQDEFLSNIIDGLVIEENSALLPDDQKLSERQDECPSNITDGHVTKENSTLLPDDQKLSKRQDEFPSYITDELINSVLLSTRSFDASKSESLNQSQKVPNTLNRAVIAIENIFDILSKISRITAKFDFSTPRDEVLDAICDPHECNYDELNDMQIKPHDSQASNNIQIPINTQDTYFTSVPSEIWVPDNMQTSNVQLPSNIQTPYIQPTYIQAPNNIGATYMQAPNSFGMPYIQSPGSIQASYFQGPSNIPGVYVQAPGVQVFSNNPAPFIQPPNNVQDPSVQAIANIHTPYLQVANNVQGPYVQPPNNLQESYVQTPSNIQGPYCIPVNYNIGAPYQMQAPYNFQDPFAQNSTHIQEVYNGPTPYYMAPVYTIPASDNIQAGSYTHAPDNLLTGVNVQESNNYAQPEKNGFNSKNKSFSYNDSPPKLLITQDGEFIIVNKAPIGKPKAKPSNVRTPNLTDIGAVRSKVDKKDLNHLPINTPQCDAADGMQELLSDALKDESHSATSPRMTNDKKKPKNNNFKKRT